MQSIPHVGAASTGVAVAPAPLPLSEVPGYLVATYRRLVSMARKRGHAWGRSRNQAEALGVSLRTFRYHVAKLRAMRWITTTTNGCELWIYPLVPLPPEDAPAKAKGRPMPAPAVPVPPIAHLIAQARGSRCTPIKTINRPATQETATEHKAPAAKPKPSPVPDCPAVVALMDAKVHRSVARSLVGVFGAARCLHVLRWAKHKRERTPEKVKSLPGTVVRAILDKWDVEGESTAEERRREVERPRRYVTAPAPEGQIAVQIASDCAVSAAGASGEPGSPSGGRLAAVGVLTALPGYRRKGQQVAG